MEKENISTFKGKKLSKNLKNVHKSNKRPPLTAAGNHSSVKESLITSKKTSVTSALKPSNAQRTAINVKSIAKNDPSASLCVTAEEENSISNVVPVNNSFDTNDSNLNSNNNNNATSNSIDSPEDNVKLIMNDVLTNIFNGFESSSSSPSPVASSTSMEHKSKVDYAHVINDCNGRINTNNCQIVSNVVSINPLLATAAYAAIDDDDDDCTRRNNMKIVNNKNNIDNTIEMATEINDVRISNNKQVKCLSFNEAADDIDEVKGDLFNDNNNSLLDDDTLDLIEIFLENRVKFINYVEEFMKKVEVNQCLEVHHHRENEVNDVACLTKQSEQGCQVNMDKGQMVQQSDVEPAVEVNQADEIIEFGQVKQNDEEFEVNHIDFNDETFQSVQTAEMAQLVEPVEENQGMQIIESDQLTRTVEEIEVTEVIESDRLVSIVEENEVTKVVESDRLVKTDQNSHYGGADKTTQMNQIDRPNEVLEPDARNELSRIDDFNNQAVQADQLVQALQNIQADRSNQEKASTVNNEHELCPAEPAINSPDRNREDTSNQCANTPSSSIASTPRKVNTASKIPVRNDSSQSVSSTPKHVPSKTPVFQRPQHSKGMKKATKLQFF